MADDAAIAREMIVAPSSATDDVLRVEHITKRFGPTVALRDINMHLRKGEVLGLLGDNGAGKVDADQDPVRLPTRRRRPDVAKGRALFA